MRGRKDLWLNAEVQISSVVYDSRQAKPGSLFVAIHGEKTDGNRFIARRP